MKQQASLERSLSALEGFSPGVEVEAKGVVAAGFVDVVVLVIGLSQKFIIDVNGFPGSRGEYLYSPM